MNGDSLLVIKEIKESLRLQISDLKGDICNDIKELKKEMASRFDSSDDRIREKVSERECEERRDLCPSKTALEDLTWFKRWVMGAALLALLSLLTTAGFWILDVIQKGKG